MSGAIGMTPEQRLVAAATIIRDAIETVDTERAQLQGDSKEVATCE